MFKVDAFLEQTQYTNQIGNNICKHISIQLSHPGQGIEIDDIKHYVYRTETTFVVILSVVKCSKLCKVRHFFNERK